MTLHGEAGVVGLAQCFWLYLQVLHFALLERVRVLQFLHQFLLSLLEFFDSPPFQIGVTHVLACSLPSTLLDLMNEAVLRVLSSVKGVLKAFVDTPGKQLLLHEFTLLSFLNFLMSLTNRLFYLLTTYHIIKKVLFSYFSDTVFILPLLIS